MPAGTGPAAARDAGGRPDGCIIPDPPIARSFDSATHGVQLIGRQVRRQALGHGRQERRLGRVGPQLASQRDQLQPVWCRVQPTPLARALRLRFRHRFERNPDGNGCDCSGYFPGEGKYKDPERPNVDFASMMAEKDVMAEIEANKKDGDVPGAPGCYN